MMSRKLKFSALTTQSFAFTDDKKLRSTCRKTNKKYVCNAIRLSQLKSRTGFPK